MRNKSSRLSFCSRAFCALAFCALSLGSTAAWGQCPVDAVTLIPDRNNTLYEDAGGALSNGAGDHLFAGTTGLNLITRGLVHFDVAGAVAPGSIIGNASFLLTLNQPMDHGIQEISLHRVLADWGEGTSLAASGEGGGGSATAGDATWLHTFFSSSTWSAPGGDFAPMASAAIMIDSNTGGSFMWNSMQLRLDAQDWLDSPSTNHGWLVQGPEGVGTTALRFNSRHNTGAEPVLCLELCPDAGPACPEIFNDDFETGDTSAWDRTVT